MRLQTSQQDIAVAFGVRMPRRESVYPSHLLPRVRGSCPMGCGETLFLAIDGFVTCSYAHCPDPSRACDILMDRSLVETLAGDPSPCGESPANVTLEGGAARASAPRRGRLGTPATATATDAGSSLERECKEGRA